MTDNATYTSVTKAIHEISGDAEFAKRVGDQIRSRQVIKSLVSRRVSQGLSQSVVAEHLNCTQSRVSKIENAFDADLKLEELEAYAKALACDVTLLFAPRGMSLTEQVKFHAFRIKEALSQLVALAHDDDAMVRGVAKLHVEAFVNVARFIQETSTQLPGHRDSDEPHVRIAEHDVSEQAGFGRPTDSTHHSPGAVPV